MRPTGVTVLAISGYILAGMAVAMAVFTLFSGADPLRSVWGWIIFGRVFPAFGLAQAYVVVGASRVAGTSVLTMNAITAVIELCAAALHAVTAYGLWKIRRWARLLCVVLLAIGIAAATLGALRPRMPFRLSAAFWLVAETSALIYLLISPNRTAVQWR